MKRLMKHAALVLPFALLLGACDDGDTMGSDTGTVSLALTDAPGDVAAAWVTIDRIYLQPGSDEDGEGDMDGDGQQRVDLMTEDLTVDLVTLADDIEDLVDEVPVPTGFYEQLRVVVPQACIAVETDVEGEYEFYSTAGFDASLVPEADLDFAAACESADGRLQTPSFAQSGIKVKFMDGGLDVENGDHYLLLDFDVSESFGHQAGNSGMWVMHPVIRATEFGLSATLTVNLTAAEGVVLPEVEVAEGDTLSLDDFVADLSTEETDAAFTDEDGDGTYTAVFPYLAPDDALDYIVSIQAPEGLTGYTFTFDPVTASIDLLSGQDVVVDFTLAEVAAVEE